MSRCNLDKVNLLMICRTMGMGGTEKVVLQLCETFADKVSSITVASSGGVNEARLVELGVRHETIPDFTDKSLSSCIHISLILRRIVKENQINLIHCHHRMAALYARVLFPNITKVSTAHNVFEDKRKLTRLAYGSQTVVACGPRVEENLTDYYGLSPRCVSLVTNSVQPYNKSVMPIPAIKSVPDGILKVGFLGRLSEQKGAKYLIEAMRILQERGVPVRCFVAGEGEQETVLRGKVIEDSLGGAVTFLGRVDGSQNLLMQLDVLAMPSLWEGLPLSLIEAFSVGVPVVGTSVDGIMDALVDNSNGLVVPPRDAEAMADALARLADDSELLCRVSAGAKNTYNEHFSYADWQRDYEGVYKKALLQ